MKWNDLGVGRRLWLVVLGLLLAVLAVATWAQLNSARLMDEALATIERYDARIADAVRWRGMTETAVTMVVGSAITTDASLARIYDSRVKQLIGQITTLQDGIARAATSAEDQAALRAIATERTRVLAMTARAAEIKQAGGDVQAFVDGEYQSAIQAYLKALDGFVAAQERQRDQARRAAEEARRHGSFLGLGLVGLIVLVGIGLTAALVRSIVRPLDRAVRAAGAIAGGDLTLQLQDARRDEFGTLLHALAGMIDRLRGIVGEVRGGVESVSAASTQIATGNQDLSSRTEQTASSLQQTAASMEELTSTVTQSADAARQADQLAAQAAQAAGQGGEIVGEVVRSMQQISEASRKIADIIGTIDAIAFQTNILALNAAVEAARAGEQGRGFAVVASEVRALASRSAGAAKEIKALIGASVETVESGSAQVARAGASMQEIVSGVRRVSDLIGEINASTGEQRDGIGQINLAVAQLDQMTQQNAALVEQSAAAAAGLRDQAQRLTRVVGVFNVGGGALASPQAAPRPLAPAIPSVRAAAPAKLAVKLLAKPAAKPAAKPVVKPLAKPAAKPVAGPAAADDGDWESF